MKSKWTELWDKWKTKKISKNQILIVFLAGILLLVITLPGKSETESESLFGSSQSQEIKVAGSVAGEGGTWTEQEYTENLESRLEEILSQMEGAGEVTVMITLASSTEQVVEKDQESQSETVTEEDSQGGSRTTQNASSTETTVYDSQSSQEQTPYVTKQKMPQVEGVVVLAQGGEDGVVVKNITEAVQALFGLDTHKIRVVKKN